MLKILHLEDRRDDAFLIEQSLAEGGVEARFTVAKGRLEFIHALDKHSFDLILADNGLPGFSGLEALQMVRLRWPDMGFICVSGAASDEHVLKCLNAGANGYVLKDQPWQLVAAVKAETERLRLARMNAGMARLVLAVQELSLARDLDTIMAIVRQAARELTGADGATFVLREREQCYYADENAIAPLWKGQRFPLSACISGWAMINRQAAVIEDIYSDSRIPAEAYRPTFVRSLAMVPIRTAAPIGAIGNYWATKRMPTPEEVELLQALANTTSVAMENMQVYNELEQRVKHRTAELEAANRELESFSYAVSHDLGAPLRSIQAFTQKLANGSETSLGATGKQYLSRIQTNASQMRTLIDDLLGLAQVSRAPLKRHAANFSAMAEEIIAQLIASSPERKVEVQIEAALEAEGDPGLLRVVLQNLLSNAWKYTANREVAQIKFGQAPQPDGSVCYYVRDNGAGFDMQYADKLFQPFQRLHSQDDFPGTGIGLATVQRIMQRHGGRIWVEAQISEGATFYFTLGK